MECQGFVLLFPCACHIWFLYPNFSLYLFTTFKTVTTYVAIKSTALHGLFQDPSYWLFYTEGRSQFLVGLLNVKASRLQDLIATAKAIPLSYVHFHHNFLSLQQWSFNGTSKPSLLRFIAFYININQCSWRVTVSLTEQFLPRTVVLGMVVGQAVGDAQ